MFKERREGLGLTREQLAKKAKVTTAYVSMMEAGKRKNPVDREQLKRDCADALEVLLRDQRVDRIAELIHCGPSEHRTASTGN